LGYQLWASPETGYRRTGTRLSELRALLGEGIVTRTICEPLYCCRRSEPAEEIQKLLKRRGFDVAGVRESPATVIEGYVVTDQLTGGSIADHILGIGPGNLISESTALSDLLGALRQKEFSFVLTGSDVAGIVTRADLNKPPLRLYLFGVVSLLEMHMQYWIERDYANESWKDSLSAGRLKKAADTHRSRKKRKEDIRLIDCLQFCDKRVLLIRKKELREMLDLGTEHEAATMFERAEELRNDLAHSQHDLVGGSSWVDQIQLLSKMEAVIHTSDEVIAHEGLKVKNGEAD
jgi:hypothetical protein